ncbi:MAG TPA: sensor histidine kinase [Mycobacteriales bacterium]|nr:sensor histidine kinase [Mycobacteriales bacterium]
MFGNTRLRQAIFDWAGPVVIAVIGVVDIASHQDTKDFPGSPAVHLTYLLVGAAIFGFRRRFPIFVPFLVIAVATAWATRWQGHNQGAFEAFLLMVAASYAIGADNRGIRQRWASAALVGYFVASQILLLATSGSLGDLLPLIVWMAVAWGIGLVIRSRGDQARRARRLAAQLEESQQHRTAEAVEQERSRIARELHDVVAHGLSVIVVQAAAERRALSHGTADPVSTAAVLDSVERAGREALVDLRRLLGLLRQVDEQPSLEPQPSLAQLDVLTAPLHEAGLEVAVRVEGSAQELPAGVGLTAYRIVQEALTNVLKHAQARRVDIVIRHARGRLDIEVVDDGGGTGREPAAPGGGHGLLGMRERVSIFGGTVTTGPRPEGGWAVKARLPLGSQMLESA